MIRFTRKKVSQTAAGLASALALAIGASAAHAAPVTEFINLDYFNGNLEQATANYGGDSISASVSQTAGGVSISDTGYGTTPVTGAGYDFKFNYLFTIGASSSPVASSLALFGSSTALTGLSVKLVDVSSHTLIATATAGTGVDLGDWNLSASNLASGDTYDVIIKGSIVPGAPGSFVTAGLAGSIQAIPLPGSLALFGSGLIALGGLARRRRAKNVAALGALLVVPTGLLLSAGTAEASSITESSALIGGPLTTGSAVTVVSSLGSSGLASGYAFFTPSKAPTTPVTTPLLGAHEVIYNYTLTAAKAEVLTLNFSGISHLSLSPSDVSLYDVTTGKTVATGTQGSGSNSVKLVAGLENVTSTGEKTTDTFEIIVDLKGLVAGTTYGKITGTGSAVSAVPVPGALVLFGSGLVGLAAFGRRSRKNTAAV